MHELFVLLHDLFAEISFLFLAAVSKTMAMLEGGHNEIAKQKGEYARIFFFEMIWVLP